MLMLVRLRIRGRGGLWIYRIDSLILWLEQFHQFTVTILRPKSPVLNQKKVVAV
jgi:hypothetical protein